MKKLMNEQAHVFNAAGVAHHTAGRYEDALREYQRAIALEADHLDIYYNMGLSLLALNKIEQANTAFQSIIKKAPLNVPAHYQLGKMAFVQEDYQKAIEHFSIARKQDPDLFELYLNLGHCYLKLKEPAEAEKYYQAALLFETQESELYFNLGVAAEHQSAPQRAFEYYEKVLAKEPAHFEACNNVAVMMLRSQNLPRALVYFKRALAIQPGNASLQYIVNMISQDKRLEAAPTEYVKQLFDSYADMFEQHVLESLNYKIPQDLLALFQEAIPQARQDLQIVDLGCGTGLCGPLFAPYAKHLLGVDLSQNMLAMAAKKKVYDELVCDDLVHFLETKRHVFDAVIAADVFVYIGKLDDVFKLVSGALKPGGHFLFSVEASKAEEGFVSHASGRFSHTPMYLARLAEDHGFKIMDWESVVSREQRGEPVSGFVYWMRV